MRLRHWQGCRSKSVVEAPSRRPVPSRAHRLRVQMRCGHRAGSGHTGATAHATVRSTADVVHTRVLITVQIAATTAAAAATASAAAVQIGPLCSSCALFAFAQSAHFGCLPLAPVMRLNGRFGASLMLQRTAHRGRRRRGRCSGNRHRHRGRCGSSRCSGGPAAARHYVNARKALATSISAATANTAASSDAASRRLRQTRRRWRRCQHIGGMRGEDGQRLWPVWRAVAPAAAEDITSHHISGSLSEREGQGGAQRTAYSALSSAMILSLRMSSVLAVS
jgi:hypothetical protein